MTDMFYERLSDYWAMLFPQSTTWSRVIVVLALIGLVGVGRSGACGPAPSSASCASATASGPCLWPQSHLWNARLLPFFYLTRDLLVAMGVAEIGLFIARLLRPGDARVREWFRVRHARVRRHRRPHRPRPAPPEPAVLRRSAGTGREWVYEAGPISVKSQPAYVDDWAKWNYSGYEGKDAYGEYSGVVNTMKQVGQEQRLRPGALGEQQRPRTATARRWR